MTSAGELKKSADAGSTRKPGLSCAECRRSKLKCDRTFPCQACIRRGCASICPDGALNATKGNKVLAAHAQKLAEQVKTLSARVRELEAALAETSNGNPSRHLMNDPRSNSTTEIDALYEKGFQVVTESMGSLSIGSGGQANYHGESAATEYLKELIPDLEGELADATDHPERLTLPYELLELMNAFPFGIKTSAHTKTLFAPFLPSRSRAEYIAGLYYKYAAWMYDPITRSELESDILDHIYLNTDYNINVEGIHSHRLSAFFMILGAGIMYDPSPDSQSVAKRYYALAKAALSFDPITKDVSCATIQSLLVMFRYHYNMDRRSNEVRWLIIGVCSRVALKIGLHRDSSGWGLDPEEQQRRRRLFWELYMNDTWTSIVNGRPPSMMIQHTDCQFPEDLEPLVRPTGETEMGWHAWKSRYAASCLSISVQHIFITKKLPYTALLDLDKKIRMFPVPTHLQAPLSAADTRRSWSTDSGRAMQQYCVLCERESNLLYLHRSFFAQALKEDPANPLGHRYASSLVATHRSACRLISSLKCLYPNHSEMAQTSWFFWSGVFSSCIVLGALVVESPGCSLSASAFAEFEGALPFFVEGSKICRPPNTSDILETLFQRAQDSYSAFLRGNGQTTERFPSNTMVSENPDVFEVLGGRPSVITRSTSNSPKSSASSHTAPLPMQTDCVGSPYSAERDMMDYYDNLALGGAPQEQQPGPSAHYPHPRSTSANHSGQGHGQVEAYSQTHTPYPMQYHAQNQQGPNGANVGVHVYEAQIAPEQYYAQHPGMQRNHEGYSMHSHHEQRQQQPPGSSPYRPHAPYAQQQQQTLEGPAPLPQTQHDIWRNFAREFVGIETL
ncbi:hypothetical protein PM082_010766 [Marasmius tenuissimus]|nr:hypothetical protein PM082_010766 [Marasmius tenuissimus]